MPVQRKKRLLISITNPEYTQRQKLEGILTYVRERKNDSWYVQIDTGGFTRQILSGISNWQCDGIIAFIDNPSERRRYIQSHVPTDLIDPFLDIRQPPPSRRKNLIFFANDHAAEGRTAAAYFLDRHYRSFAYVGDPESTFWSQCRCRGFCAALKDAGFGCSTYTDIPGPLRDDFALEMPRLEKWIAALPKRTAIFTTHDFRARQILMITDILGISVPHDLAILGVDDDTIVCETSTPALSSIPSHDFTLGYASCRALNEMLTGRTSPRGRLICTRHTQVTTRASTSLQAISDSFVAHALAFAESHLDHDLTADTIAREIGYSKRMLQIRIRQSLGTTLGREILRLRLTAAKKMLEEENRPIIEIATACGFYGTSHLGAHFKRAYGLSPRQYRAKSGLQSLM